MTASPLDGSAAFRGFCVRDCPLTQSSAHLAASLQAQPFHVRICPELTKAFLSQNIGFLSGKKKKKSKITFGNRECPASWKNTCSEKKMHLYVPMTPLLPRAPEHTSQVETRTGTRSPATAGRRVWGAATHHVPLPTWGSSPHPLWCLWPHQGLQ